MLITAPDKLLVRRIHAGDCDALKPLFDRLEQPLLDFCSSLTGDHNSAARAAYGAFTVAVERTAAKRTTARGFRSLLLEEARSRSYDEVTDRVQSDRPKGDTPRPAPLDLDALCGRIQQLRPSKPIGMGMQMSPRRKLSPATALMVSLLMVLMIDLVASGQPFGLHRHHERQASHPASTVVVADTSQSRVAANTRRAAVKKRASTKRDRGSVRKIGSKQPAGRGGESAPSNSGSSSSPAAVTPSSSSPASQLPSKPPVPSVNVSPDLPDVPVVDQVLPAVPPVKVEAGPVKVDVQAPSASVCVGSACVGAR